MSPVAPARSRLRRAVAALAALGVVAFGLVPVSAAYAAPGNVTATIHDVNGDPLTTQMVIEFPDGATMGVIPDANGHINMTLSAGSYKLQTWDFLRYPDWELPFDVVDNETTALGTITLDQHPSVVGSVPAELGGEVSVHTYRWEDGNWYQVSITPFPTDSNGEFQIWFSGAPADWTLQFVPSDSIPYLTTYLGGGDELPPGPAIGVSFTPGSINDVLDLGETELLDAGVISGNVSGYGVGPLDDATVTAFDPDHTVITRVDSDATGNYTLKVPLGIDVAVYAYGDSWHGEYYNNVTSITAADTRTLTSVDSTWTNVDFELFPEVSAYFDVVADTGDGPEPFAVDSWLYYSFGGGFSPIPFEIDWDDNNADFSWLPQGQYRLGLQLPDGSDWLPFSTQNTVPGDLTGSSSSCYFEFTVDGNHTELAFDVTAEPDATSCTEAPWMDGAGEPGEVTGFVDDIELMTGPVTATLYLPDQYGELFPIVSDVANVDGSFTLPGVYVGGEYFVGVDSGRTDPYLETVFGASDRQHLVHVYDIDIDGFLIDGGYDLDVGTLPLLPASVLSGVVTLRDEPAEDVCVELETADDGEFIMCDETDQNGRYYLKAPVPENPGASPLEYRILAYPEGAFFPTYYGDEWFMGDIIEVETAGLDPKQYDIAILTMPSFIVGQVATGDFDYSTSEVPNGVAHLYKKSGANWVNVDSFPLTQESWMSEFAFPSDLLDVLYGGDPSDILSLPTVAPGDYRIYFSQNGDWLPVTEYVVGMLTLPSDYSETQVETSGCFVSLSNFALDSIAMVYQAIVDPHLELDCTPPAPSAPGGGGTSTPKPPKSVTPLFELTEDLIDEPGEEEVEEPTPSPTPVPSAAPSPSPTPDPDASGGPAPSGPDLSWLWWGGGVLLLIIIAGGTALIIRRP